MDSASSIRAALGVVRDLHAAAAREPGLLEALHAVKALQARRFRGTYSDLLQDPVFAPAALFFLDELYGAHDFSERDAQFDRIAGSIALAFPDQVARTAVLLAQLHALTETLDMEVARHWLTQAASRSEAGRYVDAWRLAGSRQQRVQQLDSVLELGRDLHRLTRKPGLRLMLRMMRKPAIAAGLAALQRFLELGFETFGSMAGRSGKVEQFLSTVERRETDLFDVLFEGELVASETSLAGLLGQAR